MKSEAEILQLILLEAPKLDIHLMRNNSGAFKDADGRLVRFGLGNSSSRVNETLKSSDLIGFSKINGCFVAIEVKKENWKRDFKDDREQAQSNFMTFVRACGGKAGFAQSVEDFRNIIENHV